jgi:hypothetical protein
LSFIDVPEKRAFSAYGLAMTSEFRHDRAYPFQTIGPAFTVSVMDTGAFRWLPSLGALLMAASVLQLSALPAGAATKSGKKPVANYGAIAFHRESGSNGFSFNQRTARDASVEALKHCAHENCEVVLGIRNACGALASSKAGYGVSQGATRAEAETKALKRCGAGCSPIIWTCTRQ